MKRIVDGVTYNTATSTILAQSDYDTDYNHEAYSCTGKLYQTRGGAYFVHENIFFGLDPDDEVESTKDRCRAFTAEQAQEWLMTGDVEVFHNPFGEPPEAEAEKEASATIYIRLPQVLKQRVDERARRENLSANAWATRCLESCLARRFI